MSFQFTCPQGHLLEAELEHVGQQSQCPICGTVMLIPSAPPTATLINTNQPASEPPSPNASPPSMPVIETASAGQSGGPDVVPPMVGGAGNQLPPIVSDKPAELLHIPCPNGHELETPREMLDQLAMCPTCNAQFHLLERDSVEYQRRREVEEAARSAKLERNWLNWAIGLVILVLLGLAALILMSVLNQES